MELEKEIRTSTEDASYQQCSQSTRRTENGGAVDAGVEQFALRSWVPRLVEKERILNV